MRRVVTRDDYFAAALDVLATNGHGGLRIGSLCRAIGVTTGSFYHYFGSWGRFVDELLAHWERDKAQRLAEVVAAETDTVGRILLMKQMALALPHEGETAVRAWGHVNAAVGEAQRRVDQERLDAVRAVISAVVGDRRRADQLAVLGVTLLVGIQQWRSPVDVEELGRVFGEYEDLIFEHAPTAASR